jgi:hypothetical protein
LRLEHTPAPLPMPIHVHKRSLLPSRNPLPLLPRKPLQSVPEPAWLLETVPIPKQVPIQMY